MKIIKIFISLIAILTNFNYRAGSDNIEFRSIRNLEIIKEINSMNTTWKAGINERFNKLSIEDIKGIMGTFKNTNRKKDPNEKALPEKKVEKIANLPENFDLREKWPQCESIKEIRDQGACGSCWAMAAVDAMSDRICIRSKGKLQERMSAEHLISCCDYCGNGCFGGYPAAAWDYFQNEGLVTGGLYGDNKSCLPYSFKPCDHNIEGKYGLCKGNGPTPPCRNSCNYGYDSYFMDDLWFGISSYSISKDEEEIKSEIFTNGSVQATYDVFEDLLAYKSGVYIHVKGESLGGHSVRIIGWGIEDGNKYWLIANSWNETWGNNGTFKIQRGSNHLGIESEIFGGIPGFNHDINSSNNINSSSLKFLE
jgi:cathepsin B